MAILALWLACVHGTAHRAVPAGPDADSAPTEASSDSANDSVPSTPPMDTATPPPQTNALGLIVCPPGTGPDDIVCYGLDWTDDVTANLARIELATGGQTDALDIAGVNVSDTNALALFDGGLAICAFRRVVRISLVDGSVERSDVDCTSVGAWRGGLFVYSAFFRTVAQYPTWADVVAHTPTLDHESHLMHSEAITTVGDVGVGMWHSASSFETFTVPQATVVTDVRLEDYDDWEHGLSIVNGQLLVLAHVDDDAIVAFDQSTGAQLWIRQIGDQGPRPYGLACGCEP